MPAPSKEAHQVCAPAQKALYDCKASLGLLPQQCYKPKGGTCDSEEFQLKKCLSFLYNERDARVLYNTNAARDERVAANRRLQKQLERFNVQCHIEGCQCSVCAAARRRQASSATAMGSSPAVAGAVSGA